MATECASGSSPGHVPSLVCCRCDATQAGNDDHPNDTTSLLHATIYLSVSQFDL